MTYSIKLKTESPKTSVETNCNDFDMALRYFQMYVKQHWDIIGDVEVILVQHADGNGKVLYLLTKSY